MLASLFSGGKDSIFSIYYALNQGLEVRYLITVKAKEDSMYWHYQNIEWTKLQAEAMGIPLVEVSDEDSLKAIIEEMREKREIFGLLSGVIYSDFQRDYLIKICKEVGLKLITPLWMKNPIKLLEKIVECKIHAIIVFVAAEGLNQDWLGVEINREVINKLIEKNKKYGISICGEGGEYETFVYDAPFFNKKIKIGEVERIWMKDRGLLKIKSAELISK